EIDATGLRDVVRILARFKVGHGKKRNWEEGSRPPREGSLFACGQALQVPPELRVLFEQLLFRYGQFRPEEEVLQGVFVQDVMGVELVPRQFEVEPKIAGAQTIEHLPAAGETPERFMRIGQILRRQAADRVN